MTINRARPAPVIRECGSTGSCQRSDIPRPVNDRVIAQRGGVGRRSRPHNGGLLRESKGNRQPPGTRSAAAGSAPILRATAHRPQRARTRVGPPRSSPVSVRRRRRHLVSDHAKPARQKCHTLHTLLIQGRQYSTTIRAVSPSVQSGGRVQQDPHSPDLRGRTPVVPGPAAPPTAPPRRGCSPSAAGHQGRGAR